MMPNKMKITTSAPSILILQVFLRLASTNVFLINRNPPGQPWLSRDSFRIPSSLCHRNNTNGECDLFKALGYKASKLFLLLSVSKLLICLSREQMDVS